MEELIQRANQFLKDNLDINEIELQDGAIRVHLIRFTPAPINYTSWAWTPGWAWTQLK